MVTIKELAESTGVSRGTVDRVLHDRGRVSPEVRELVLNKAKELGYQPNRAGKILAARKQPHLIGVVLPSEGNPFFNDVIRGMECADREYSELGFSMEIKEIRGFDKDKHISYFHFLMNQQRDNFRFKTLGELIKYCKANPRKRIGSKDLVVYAYFFMEEVKMAFRVLLIENEVTIKVKLNNLIVTRA